MPESGRPVPPSEAWDLSGVRAATARSRERGWKESWLAAGILAGAGGFVVLLGWFVYPTPWGADSGTICFWLGGFAIGSSPLILVARRAMDPRADGPSPVRIRADQKILIIELSEGSETSVGWTDPALLVRIIDESVSRFYRPGENRYYLDVTQLPWGQGKHVVTVAVPDEFVGWLMAAAEAQGMTLHRGRFLMGGKVKSQRIETQLRRGPAIDTLTPQTSFSRFGWTRTRVEGSDAELFPEPRGSRSRLRPHPGQLQSDRPRT